jgi:hypothetical protein
MPIDLTIAGTLIRRPAANIVLVSCLLYQKDGIPTLSFARRGIAPPLRPDPYLGKPVSLSIDGSVRFSGDCTGCLHHYDDHLGWVAEYQCQGLRYRGDLVPVTNDQTAGDSITFNLPSDDPQFIPARAGRTLGQMIESVLTGTANSAALAGYGLGAFVAAAGSGAVGTASVTSGGVSAVAVVDGGSYYSGPPSVAFWGGGGTGANGTASLGTGPDTGKVITVAVTSPGSGYTSPPQVVISRLPQSTLGDLTALRVIPPHRVTFQGDHLLDTIEAALKQVHPNHCLHIEPDTGAIRFPDLRTFMPQTLTLDTDPIRPPRVQADISQCYQAVELRGEALIESAELSLVAGSLEEVFAHDGLLTNASAKAKWKYSDFNQPAGTTGAALASATLTATTVDTVAVTAGGAGYTSAPTVAFSGGGSGATGTATLTAGQVSAVTVVNHGTGYTSPPTVTFSGGGGTGAKATARLTPTSVASLTLLDGGTSYTTAPAVSFVPIDGGTGATATTSLSADVVSSLSLTNGGSGFRVAPSVHAGGPLTPTSDYGVCDPAHNTTLSVRVKSDDPTRTWAADAWDQASGRHGTIMLFDSLLPGVRAFATRRVVANTPLTAGGTSDLTVDLPLEGTGYNSYKLHGQTGGGSVVWRRYRPTDPAVRAAMTAEPFSYPFAYQWAEGLAAQLTSYPTGTVLYSTSGGGPFNAAPIPFDVDPVNGYLITQQPVVSLYGTPTALAQGGAATDGIPSDVRFLVGLYKGDLVARAPATGYQGTSHDVEGLSRTLRITVSGWRDPGQSANMALLAQEHLDSVKDTQIEGELEYVGRWDAGLAFGVAVQIAGNGYTTGLEAIPLPVISATLAFNETGGASLYTTTLRLSNKRGRNSSEEFLLPQQTGMKWGMEIGPVVSDTSRGGYPSDQ